MSNLTEYFRQQYDELWELRDKRLDGYPMFDSPLSPILAVGSYLILVRLGVEWMRNRAPFELKRLMIVYNLVQVVINSWLFYEFCVAGWFNGYSYTCQPVDYSTSGMGMRMLRASYWYYINKLFDFSDTFLFVLRKKNHNLSLLHMVHHASVPFSIWPGVRTMPGGHITFFALLNTLVHIIMYAYYLFAAMGPQFQKFLWWKKYLTLMQMVQFILTTLHGAQIIFNGCPIPKSIVYWVAFHELLFLALFFGFYKRAYRPKSKAIEKDQ